MARRRMIEFESADIGHRYGPRAIFGLTCAFDSPGLYCALGGEKSGKTTLAKCIAGLLRAESGKTLVNGRESPDPKTANACLAPEDYGFFEHRSLMRNFEYALRIRGVPRDVAQKRAIRLIFDGGLEDWLFSPVRRMPEPAKARACVIRTKLRDADIYLFDDPFRRAENKVEAVAEFLPYFAELSKSKLVIYFTSSLEVAELLDAKTLLLHYGVSHGFGALSELRSDPLSVYGFELFRPGAERIPGRIEKKNAGAALVCAGREIPLDPSKLLNPIYVGSDVLACFDSDGRPFVFDPKSEYRIYFP